eukprot:2854695-Lingulodinium_polyedra.AAC.1
MLDLAIFGVRPPPRSRIGESICGIWRGSLWMVWWVVVEHFLRSDVPGARGGGGIPPRHTV